VKRDTVAQIVPGAGVYPAASFPARCAAGGDTSASGRTLRMTAGGTQRYQYVVPEFTPPEAEGHPMELRVKRDKSQLSLMPSRET